MITKYLISSIHSYRAIKDTLIINLNDWTMFDNKRALISQLISPYQFQFTGIYQLLRILHHKWKFHLVINYLFNLCSSIIFFNVNSINWLNIVSFIIEITLNFLKNEPFICTKFYYVFYYIFLYILLHCIFKVLFLYSTNYNYTFDVLRFNILNFNKYF